MTIARRLAVVESSLTPTQLVLRWLDEAHAHGSFTAYSEALLDAELDDLPINRLCREARRSALSTVRTRSSEEEAKAVAKAMRQALFRYFLVLRINVTTHELLEKETFIYAAMTSFVAMLAGETEPGDDHRDHLAHACRVVIGRVTVLEGAADARTLAQERYLDGRNVLFPDLVPAWDAQAATAPTTPTQGRLLRRLGLAELASRSTEDQSDQRGHVCVVDAGGWESLSERGRSARGGARIPSNDSKPTRRRGTARAGADPQASDR